MGKRVTVRMNDAECEHLAWMAESAGQTESEIVRAALDMYYKAMIREKSCYDIAERIGIIGSANVAASDLSVNKRYFKGFGRGR